MAGLMPSDDNLPKDGLITLRAGGKEMQCHISFIPGPRGQHISLWIGWD
jgi:hypothetical protein